MINSKKVKSIGTSGLGEQSWWVQQWMELINSYRYKKRLERAWIYAREGNVTSIQFEGRRVHARVQGTEKKPYKVKLWLDILLDEDWNYVIESLANNAKWSAQLMAGIMPRDIEQAFAYTGKRLFPFHLEEVKSECSCPDKANPCKHVSAIYYLMADQFREDPFILFQLRGRSRKILITDLIKRRLKINNKLLKKSMSKKLVSIQGTDSSKAQINEISSRNWWSYKNNLNDDLVVITSSTSDNIGVSNLQELPLAKNPKFTDSNDIFIQNLIKHHEVEGQKAMLQAMSITQKNLT